MKLLQDKVAIITGGSNGIGKATVKKFVQEGASVYIWDVADEAGIALADELSLAGYPAVYQHVDTINSQQIDQAIEAIIGEKGKIDVLVNNAGITRDATLLKMTDEKWDQVLEVNLTGVFKCTRAVVAKMVDKGSGVILNAASVVGLYGNFGQSNYAATKGGLISMTKTWSKELGKKGIRSNVVAPGFILTDMVRAMPEEVLQKMNEKVPLGRLGDVNDIANVYVFLASDMAAYINGAVISVDGGITL